MNNYQYISYSIFLFSIIFSCCNNSGVKREKDLETNDYLELVENKINKLIDNNLNLVVDNQTVYLGIDSLNKMELQRIIENNVFFFYFSYQTCPPCIQQTVSYIKEVFPDYENNDRIFFIAPDYPPRFRRNCYGKALLVLSKIKLGIPLEAENVPFIFSLNNKLAIEKLHIVNKEDFAKTFDFLKMLSEQVEE
ncbi:hypothetical protein FACS189440_21520 [Bacteroidia bacterium]|nr:hypothetical protein FACS189440_21520 [Bacteroidia bacterium]